MASLGLDLPFWSELDQQTRLVVWALLACVGLLIWAAISRLLKPEQSAEPAHVTAEAQLELASSAHPHSDALQTHLDAISSSQIETAAAIQETLTSHRLKHDEIAATCRELAHEFAALRSDWNERAHMSKRLARCTQERNEARKQLEAATRITEQVADADGNFWLKPLRERTAAFRPRSERKARIVSVLNLKGGVGKTTTTLNLSIALAQLGRRVLMIDLDYQRSLTILCAEGENLNLVKSKAPRIRDYLFGDHDVASHGWDDLFFTPPIESGLIHLLGTDDALNSFETKLMFEQIADAQGGDRRTRMRRALHDASISDKYDYVLIDLPPRLSIGSLNALAASDHVLIPVLPERISINAVPHLLDWIDKLRPVVFPAVNVLGVVANKVKMRAGEPQQAIQNEMLDLKAACRSKCPVLEPPIAEKAQASSLKERSKKLPASYLDLAGEIERRIVQYERANATSTARFDHRGAEAARIEETGSHVS